MNNCGKVLNGQTVDTNALIAIAQQLDVPYETLLKAIGINYIGRVVAEITNVGPVTSGTQVSLDSNGNLKNLRPIMPVSKFRILILEKHASGSPVLQPMVYDGTGKQLLPDQGLADNGVALTSLNWSVRDFQVVGTNQYNFSFSANIDNLEYFLVIELPD